MNILRQHPSLLTVHYHLTIVFGTTFPAQTGTEYVDVALKSRQVSKVSISNRGLLSAVPAVSQSFQTNDGKQATTSSLQIQCLRFHGEGSSRGLLGCDVV
jgi:hypothetical protein